MSLCAEDDTLQEFPEEFIRRYSVVADILAAGAIRAAAALKQSREQQTGQEAEAASELVLSEAA